MEKWEYLSIKISWDRKLGKWVRFDTGARAEVIHDLLNPLGQQGWELVAFESTYHTQDQYISSNVPVGYYTVVDWDTNAFRAIFKRRLS